MRSNYAQMLSLMWGLEKEAALYPGMPPEMRKRIQQSIKREKRLGPKDRKVREARVAGERAKAQGPASPGSGSGGGGAGSGPVPGSGGSGPSPAPSTPGPSILRKLQAMATPSGLGAALGALGAGGVAAGLGAPAAMAALTGVGGGILGHAAGGALGGAQPQPPKPPQPPGTPQPPGPGGPAAAPAPAQPQGYGWKGDLALHTGKAMTDLTTGAARHIGKAVLTPSNMWRALGTVGGAALGGGALALAGPIPAALGAAYGGYKGFKATRPPTMGEQIAKGLEHVTPHLSNLGNEYLRFLANRQAIQGSGYRNPGF